MGVTLRERSRSKGRTTLYLDIYENGVRRLENTGIHLTGDKVADKERRRMADVLRTQREMEQLGYRIGVTPAFKRKTELLAYLDAQAQRKLDQGSSEDQVNSYRSAVKMIRQYSKQSIDIAAVTPEWLEGFKTFLQSRVKQNTAAGYFGVLRTVLNRAVRDGIIQTNPSKRVDLIRKVESQRTYLTIEEVQRLADTPCDYPSIKNAFLFGCFAGVRIGDIERLTWSQVVGDQLEFRQKKTGGVLYLPLNESALKFLGSRGTDSDNVFEIPGRRTLAYQLKKWVREAGISKAVSFHTSRHTFATLSLTAGVDLFTVSKLLGHRNVATTQIYAKVVDSKKREAVEMLPMIDFAG